MKVQILIDNPSSWMFDFKDELEILLKEKGHNVLVIDSHKKISSGNILFLLSCEEKLVDFDLNNLMIIRSSLFKIGFTDLANKITYEIMTSKFINF